MAPEAVTLEGPAADELVDALDQLREHVRALDHDTETIRTLAEARAVVTTCDFLESRQGKGSVEAHQTTTAARQLAIAVMYDALEEFIAYRGSP